MRKDKEDRSQDPQQTLPPGNAQRARRIEIHETDSPASEPGGRRLKFGTPTRNATNTALRQTVDLPEVSPAVQRGFTLGPEAPINLSLAKASKSKIQPWILMVAGGALLLLVVALLLAPSSASKGEANANARLLAQYTKYLETKGPASGIDVAARHKDVVARLQAVEWAKAIGDKSALETELTTLMFLDNDKTSPLYNYSVSQLKQMGPARRGAGL